jgi:hypothetical protein
MAENKTKPTDASVEDYIASSAMVPTGTANEQQRSDSRELMILLKMVTQQPPRMWGPSRRGFDPIPQGVRKILIARTGSGRENSS